MDLAQLRTFVAAAETGGFLAAASVVHASSSAVTERIAALEHRLGARLFDRSRKGCLLTAAGEAFLPRARTMISVWDISRTEAAIPPQFTEKARIGGQFSLWPSFLIDWSEQLREERPQLAMTLVAGSADRLNRDLGAGLLDLAIVYKPQLGPLLQARRVFTDRLVLVRSAHLERWQDGWVDIDWGEELRMQFASVVELASGTGVRLDLGGLAIRWLEEAEAAGYVPQHLAQKALARGSLIAVDDMPSFDFPILAVWNTAQTQLAEPLAGSLADFMAGARDAPDEE
ncbi:MAG: LysR family transcriptional regulator [Erythrobacter sp.]